MHDLLRNAHIQLALSTALILTGCHATSVCEPPGATAGTIVRARNSDAYLAQMNKVGGDVEHIACRAESNIETQVLFLRNAEPSPRLQGGTSMTSADSTPYDPRVMTQRENIGKYAGKYRVLGV